MNLATRLREERERLGLTQAGLAELVGVSARGQQDWERGLTVPNAAYLTAIAALGADVQFVLTGIRILDPALQAAWQQSALFTIGSGLNQDVAETLIKAYGQTSASLTQEELDLVGLFRRCSPAARASILEWAGERAAPPTAAPVLPPELVQRIQAPEAKSKPSGPSRTKVLQDFGNAQIGQVVGEVHAPQTFSFTGKKSRASAAGKARTGKD